MRDHVLLQAIARVNRPYEDAAGVKKPCGLVVDFVGVLKELNKAPAFDDKDVSGVIADLDALLARFRELMQGAAQQYLAEMSGRGGNDAVLDRLLYQTFLDKESRRRFAESFKEIEGLYEVLSPSAELRDYITPYNRLAELYVILRNTYGPQEFLYGDRGSQDRTAGARQCHDCRSVPRDANGHLRRGGPRGAPAEAGHRCG